MPVGCMGSCECPNYTIHGKPLLNMVILGNVKGVIEIDKLMIESLPVKRTGTEYQKYAYHEFAEHRVLLSSVVVRPMSADHEDTSGFS